MRSPTFKLRQRNVFAALNAIDDQLALRLQLNAMLRQAFGHNVAIANAFGWRTFITTLAHKGVLIRVLAELAGHRSIATTQRYIELNENVLRAAVELV